MTERMTQNLSKEIFQQKYMINGEESVEDVLRGVAEEISFAENDELREDIRTQFEDALLSGYLIPAGRILANARPNSRVENYNNCFTIEIMDSLEDIYESLKEDAKISKVGGGVGFDASHIRPKGTSLSTGGEASGVISFLKVFDQSAKTIMTGGQRRSAHIALLDCSHPDIVEFITCKHGDENNVLTQFNISVKITNDFIQAVKDDADWDLTFEGTVYNTIKAKKLYDLIIDNSYDFAEPGLMFVDNANQVNNVWWDPDMLMVACNPCGEIVGSAYFVCCLSSINLSKFIHDPFSDSPYIDLEELKKYVRVGVRFLDNVLSRTKYPLDKIGAQAEKYRRIGLGVTGLGDMLAMMKYGYGSEEGNSFLNDVMREFRNASYEASCALAYEKGAFPGLDKKKYLEGEFVKRLPKGIKDLIAKYGIRNAYLNTIAPTGTTSLSLGNNCSSGVEPIFALQYDRSVRTGRGDETRTETVYDNAWLEYLKWNDHTRLVSDGTEGKPDYFTVTNDLSIKEHLSVQSICQHYIDQSISKTFNAPAGSPKEDIGGMILDAWEAGLKGFTIFHPDGKLKPVISTKDSQKDSPAGEIQPSGAPKRPKALSCDIRELKYKKSNYIALVGLLEGQPYEVFLTPNFDGELDMHRNKTGQIVKVKKRHYRLVSGETVLVNNIVESFDPELATLCRMVSGSLRHGIPVEFIRKQLDESNAITSFPKVLSRVLKKYEGEVSAIKILCPECGKEAEKRDGCPMCPECGWSKCS